jgi:D-alanyl-D-alanine carboxypeptidase (penicillin-binding protein 5/6)
VLCAPVLSALVGVLVATFLFSSAAVASVIGPRSSIVYAPQTGQTLYAWRAHQELPIASATKLMTALVVLQHVHRLSTVFAAPDYYSPPADSQIGLVPGERMRVHDLLVALMLPSADDAAEDLAYNVGHRPGRSLSGSVARFVGMMNAEARALGLRETHYTTPIGLDTAGNYSSASDLARLAAFDRAHSRFFAKIVGRPAAVLGSGNHVRYVINRNDLVGRYAWVDGVKTGHTAAAGYVLVASGHRHGMSLITVVLGTPSLAARDADSLIALRYGFDRFRLARLLSAGTVLARPSVRDQSGKRAQVVVAHSVQRVVGRRTRARLRVHVPAELSGPLARGEVVGTVTVLVSGRSVARVALVLDKALPAASPITVAADFFTRPLTLLVILLVVGGAVAVALVTRQRRRPRAGKGGLEPA